MSYKQVLIIREKPPNFEAEIKRESTANITTWCCVNQGPSRMEVKFAKNTFEPHEMAQAKVHLDNSQCKIGIKSVTLAVE
jgi:hypothetical protein